MELGSNVFLIQTAMHIFLLERNIRSSVLSLTARTADEELESCLLIIQQAFIFDVEVHVAVLESHNRYLRIIQY